MCFLFIFLLFFIITEKKVTFDTLFYPFYMWYETLKLTIVN